MNVSGGLQDLNFANLVEKESREKLLNSQMLPVNTLSTYPSSVDLLKRVENEVRSL